MSFITRPPVTLFLVRHGQSTANVDKTLYRHQPDHAIALTDLGQAQAAEAGIFLAQQIVKALTPTIMLRSPYARARQTEQLVYERCQGSVSERVELPELAEQQFGLFDGVPKDELATTFPEQYRRYLLAREQNGTFWARPPQGESLFDVYQRVTTVANMLRFSHRKNGVDNFIIVAHGNAMQCFLMAWCNLPYEWLARAPTPSNCEVIKVVGNEIAGSIFTPSSVTHEPFHVPYQSPYQQNSYQTE